MTISIDAYDQGANLAAIRTAQRTNFLDSAAAMVGRAQSQLPLTVGRRPRLECIATLRRNHSRRHSTRRLSA